MREDNGANPAHTVRLSDRGPRSAHPGDHPADKDLNEFMRLIAQALAEEHSTVWCTLSVHEIDRLSIVAASDDRVAALETMHRRFGDGPYLEAVRDQVLTHVGDASTDPRWQPYAAIIGESGVRSVLALPLDLAGIGAATLTIWCDRTHAFDSAQIQAVQQLLEAASSTWREAASVARLKTGRAQLAAAAVWQAVEMQAVNRLMRQNSCTKEQAFHLLAMTADRRGMPVHARAAELVAVTLQSASSARMTADIEPRERQGNHEKG